jgi:hypothetical protein
MSHCDVLHCALVKHISADDVGIAAYCSAVSGLSCRHHVWCYSMCGSTLFCKVVRRLGILRSMGCMCSVMCMSAGYIIWYYNMLYCFVLYCVVLHGIASDCGVLHRSYHVSYCYWIMCQRIACVLQLIVA